MTGTKSTGHRMLVLQGGVLLFSKLLATSSHSSVSRRAEQPLVNNPYSRTHSRPETLIKRGVFVGVQLRASRLICYSIMGNSVKDGEKGPMML